VFWLLLFTNFKLYYFFSNELALRTKSKLTAAASLASTVAAYMGRTLAFNFETMVTMA
jgi:hypothetical protein